MLSCPCAPSFALERVHSRGQGEASWAGARSWRVEPPESSQAARARPRLFAVSPQAQLYVHPGRFLTLYTHPLDCSVRSHSDSTRAAHRGSGREEHAAHDSRTSWDGSAPTRAPVARRRGARNGLRQASWTSAGDLDGNGPHRGAGARARGPRRSAAVGGSARGSRGEFQRRSRAPVQAVRGPVFADTRSACLLFVTPCDSERRAPQSRCVDSAAPIPSRDWETDPDSHVPALQMSATQSVQTFGKKKTATAVALAKVGPRLARVWCPPAEG